MIAKKLTLIVLALALVAPVAALAQPGDGPGNDAPGRAGLLSRLLPPPGYLQLTGEQKAAARGLAQELRAALEPLREEQRTLGGELRDELAGDAPDATTVGQLTLDLHAGGAQIRDEIAATEAAFRALLTPEQQTKWDNFKELRQLRRRGSRD